MKSDKFAPAKLVLAHIIMVPIIGIMGFLFCAWLCVVKAHSLRPMLSFFSKKTWYNAFEPIRLSGRYVVEITDFVKEGDRLPPYTYQQNRDIYICHRQCDAIFMKLKYRGEITKRRIRII